MLLALGLSVLYACQTERKTTVEFCLELDENGHCKESANRFPFGSKIYVSCTSNQAFEGQTMKGNIYFLKDGNKTFFNFKHFDLHPGDRVVHSYIPFDEFGGKGGFYVEFVNEKEEVLGSNSLEILK